MLIWFSLSPRERALASMYFVLERKSPTSVVYHDYMIMLEHSHCSYRRGVTLSHANKTGCLVTAGIYGNIIYLGFGGHPHHSGNWLLAAFRDSGMALRGPSSNSRALRRVHVTHWTPNYILKESKASKRPPVDRKTEKSTRMW